MTKKMNSHNCCKFRGQPPTRHPHTKSLTDFPNAGRALTKPSLIFCLSGDRPQRVFFYVYLMAQARGIMKAPNKVG